MRLTRILCCSYFKRYIEREMYEGTLRRTWHPIQGWKEKKKKDWFYNEHRPWTDEFKRTNRPGKRHPKIYVEPIKEWTIFKGDRVEILVGKDKGKQGIVNCIIKERNWCFIDGLNCDFTMQQSAPAMPPICVRDERPLLVTSQVKLVDPSDEKGVEVEWRYTDEGEKVRVSARTGRLIPLPAEARLTEDNILPTVYSDCDKDTSEKVLTEVTFEPKLKTFEEEIMQAMGIKEDRKRAVTYWY